MLRFTDNVTMFRKGDEHTEGHIKILMEILKRICSYSSSNKELKEGLVSYYISAFLEISFKFSKK